MFVAHSPDMGQELATIAAVVLLARNPAQTLEEGPSPEGTQERSSASPRKIARSALGLGSNPITVTPAYESEFKDEWASQIELRRRRHDAKAGFASNRATQHWHESRAKNLERGPMGIECNPQRFVSCACKAFPVGGCASKLCKVCNGRRWGQIRRRVLRAVRAQGGVKWRMLTLTGPPRATQEESLRDLQQAWARLRAWLYKRWKKAFDYVLVVEVGGENGLIHAHVMAKFPGFIAYDEVGVQWERCYEGAVSGGVHFSTRKDQKTGRKTSVFTPESGAYYIAKYATKGIELLDLPARLAAQTMAAMVGARHVRASQGFWTATDPLCQDCGCHFGLAKGAGLVNAIAIHRNHGQRKVAADANGAAAIHARDAWGLAEFAQPYWARRDAHPGLLVAHEGTILERVASSTC